MAARALLGMELQPAVKAAVLVEDAAAFGACGRGLLHGAFLSLPEQQLAVRHAQESYIGWRVAGQGTDLGSPEEERLSRVRAARGYATCCQAQPRRGKRGWRGL
jgi:hypothetical protein